MISFLGNKFANYQLGALVPSWTASPPPPSLLSVRQRAYYDKARQTFTAAAARFIFSAIIERAGQWRRGWPTTIVARVLVIASCECTCRAEFRKEPPRNECIRYESEIKDEWMAERMVRFCREKSNISSFVNCAALNVFFFWRIGSKSK